MYSALGMFALSSALSVCGGIASVDKWIWWVLPLRVLGFEWKFRCTWKNNSEAFMVYGYAVHDQKM
jgi:hypothetical protein